jgi:L-amino acid N-acyltransferase YncA
VSAADTAAAGGGPAGGGPAEDAGFEIRAAAEGDLDAIVGFEIEIAVVSFAEEAITDPALHRRRVSGALGKRGEVTLVAVRPGSPGEILGWAWLSARTNSLTGAKYGNFRSLAVADVPGRPLIGELLLGAVLAAAEADGMTQLTGKVHAGNLGMRSLYRKFGFTATHLTMELRPAAQPPAAEPPAAQPPAAEPVAGAEPAGGAS